MRHRLLTLSPACGQPAPAPRPRAPRRAIATLLIGFYLGGSLAWWTSNAAHAAEANADAGSAARADNIARPLNQASAQAVDAAVPAAKAPLHAVAPVDLQRYAGVWHEQARLPNRFQKQCTGPVTAQYAPLADGTIEVRNRCVRQDGSTEEAIGQARRVVVPAQPGAGRLKVRFAPAWLSWLPLVWGDYWILALDADYRIALVGTPDRQYLWLLSRAAVLEEAAMAAQLDHARTLGFDVDRVMRTGR